MYEIITASVQTYGNRYVCMCQDGIHSVLMSVWYTCSNTPSHAEISSDMLCTAFLGEGTFKAR